MAFRRLTILHGRAESLFVRGRDVRKAFKSSSEATSMDAGQAAVENLKLLIADAYQCADYDLVNRLERILKKVDVLVRNLRAAGRGGNPQSDHGEQAPYEASYAGAFRVAPHRRGDH